MQNLKTVNHYCHDLAKSPSPLTAIAWELSDHSLICTHGPTKSDPLLTLSRRKIENGIKSTESIAAWDAVHPNAQSEQVEQVVDLHCFGDDGTIVIVLAGGDIVVVNGESGVSTVEIVGSIDAGITAASWSPDEELLFITTAAETALVMTRTFAGTADTAISDEDLKISDHVSVGWGKAETQFKGRGAKALRDPTIPEHFDSGVLSSNDNGATTISWRGDGQYVAVNSIVGSCNRRVIRVYSRQGVLESVSEPVDGMEHASAWKPSGQVIASVQRTSNSMKVIFFERNGLRHGEFDLRLSSKDIENEGNAVDLSWNTSSSVLAVIFSTKIQLWTTSNYHWYLKQVISLDKNASRRSVAATWHPEKPLHLACSGGDDILHSIQYNNQYAMGSVTPPHDLGLIATIDGSSLAITPLKLANIPPPMAFDVVELTEPANDVCIGPDGNIIAVMHSQRCSLFRCSYGSSPVGRARLYKTIDISADIPHDFILLQVSIQNNEMIDVTACTPEHDSWTLIQYDVRGKLLAPPTTHPSSAAISMTSVSAHNATGSTGLLVNNKSQQEQQGENGPLVARSSVSIQQWQGATRKITFWQTESGLLTVRNNEQILRIPGCTSFVVGHSHLIFTTSQHMLKFVHLREDDLEIPPDTPEKDERCRMIERGAKIVTIIPSSFAVILQMPRGNLETIYPRALVLAGIRTSLIDRDYKEAFMICRSHRVDMNILYDYASDQFMQNVELFIDQMSKAEHIDLFLSSLSEENTAETIYKNTLAGHNSGEIPASNARNASKVNAVCDAFLKVLPKYLARFQQCMITAHVSKSPPDVAAALSLIAALRLNQQDDELSQAVEHICFLTDVNLLYDTALGMYELEVALLIAQQSQKDPREYLPHLQSLRDMEDRRQRFTIDNDLKRYKKALSHLYSLNAFEELTVFIARHELYAQAIDLYRHDKSRLEQLMRLYADFLVSRNRYSDGAIAYEFVHDFEAACQAYQSANMWREALTAAMRLPLSDANHRQLAQDLAGSLEESKDFSSAAIIYLDHLSDLVMAVKLHCKAYNFAEAMRLAILNKRPLMLEELVDPGLIECFASMSELLAEMKGQINAQVSRLRELRQKMIEEPMAYLDAAEGEGGDVPDNLSVAPTDASTSGGTFMTRYTNRSMGTLATNATRRTSRNRRREERKRAQGKKGTVYEEEYLVNSIFRLVERLNTVSSDVTSLVQGLMKRSMRERAVVVETTMTELQELCTLHIPEVFQTGRHVVSVEPQGESAAENYRPVGADGVLMASIAASLKPVEPPILKKFERLSLIA